jgi:copper chaperone CopZ
MVKIILTVKGMRCGMCEAHINDAIRRAFPVKKVASSHKKSQTVLVAQEDLEEAALRETLGEIGYEVTAIAREPYEKKHFLRF